MVNQIAAPTLSQAAAHWWGPNGHTLLFYEVDFSDGGCSRLRVRSPEGREYWVEDAQLDIVEPERIVFSGTLEAERESLTEGPPIVTFRRAEG